jgi:hypothetical protein
MHNIKVNIKHQENRAIQHTGQLFRLKNDQVVIPNILGSCVYGWLPIKSFHLKLTAYPNHSFNDSSQRASKTTVVIP